MQPQAKANVSRKITKIWSMYSNLFLLHFHNTMIVHKSDMFSKCNAVDE